MLTAIVPLALVCAIVGFITFSLLARHGEGRLQLFADAVISGAGSVFGIWLGLAIIGLVLGCVVAGFVAGVVLLFATILERLSGMLLPPKGFLAASIGFIAGARMFWRFASFGFLRR